jgi:hypothetical protein
VQTRTADIVHRDSATALVYTQPHLVLHHVDQAHLAQVTLVLPRCPDVDALVAAYFVQELLDKGCLPAEAWQMVEYVQRVQTGTLPLTPSMWHTPYGVMLGIRGRNLRYCREHALSQTQQDLYDVQRTFYFLRYLIERLAAGVDIVSTKVSGQAILFDEAGPIQPPFERERDFVRRDLEAYDRDVARAYTFDAVLPVLGLSGSMRHSTAIAVEDPTSTLFATWAHEDTRHLTAGFDLVVLCERQHHYRLSVKPTAGICLQGLSSALGHAEIAKLHLPEEGDIYTMPRLTPASTSVWDDQGIPDQTLLETTRQGTILTLAEVLQLVQDARRWRP